MRSEKADTRKIREKIHFDNKNSTGNTTLEASSRVTTIRPSILKPRVPIDKETFLKRKSVHNSYGSGPVKSNWFQNGADELTVEDEVNILKSDLKKSDTMGAVISCCGILLAWIEERNFMFRSMLIYPSLCLGDYIFLQDSLIIIQFGLVVELSEFGFQANSQFALKAYMKYRSLVLLTTLLGCSIIIFGVALRTLERPNRLNYDKLDYFWNSVWVVIVSMCTIGYGDITPRTHLGRLVVIVATIWGQFLLSLFVVTLNNIVMLTKNQKKAYDDLIRNELIKDQLRPDAARIIKTCSSIAVSKKQKEDVKKRFLMRMDLMGQVSRFRIKRKNVLNESQSVAMIIQDMNENIEEKKQYFLEKFHHLESLPKQVRVVKNYQEVIKQGSEKLRKSSEKIFSIFQDISSDINLTDFTKGFEVKANDAEFLHKLASKNLERKTDDPRKSTIPGYVPD